MTQLKISIITVCYNAKDVIERTIISVSEQTYKDIEYIIVDGGSTDGTLEIITKYKQDISYYVSEPDKGIYDAMNKGVLASTGDWMVFLNAGDSFISNTTVSDVFNKYYIGAGVIFGDVKVVDTFGSYILRAGKPEELEKGRLCFCHQSSFIKCSLMKSHLYDLKYRVCADFNLFYQLWKEKQIFIQVSIPIAVYDVSKGSYGMSNSKIALIEGYQIIGKNKFRDKIKLGAIIIKNRVKQLLIYFEPTSHRTKRIQHSLSLNKRVVWHSW